MADQKMWSGGLKSSPIRKSQAKKSL